MSNHLKYLKSRLQNNIEPFNDWLVNTINKVYLFHGWDISNMQKKIEEIKTMIESKFNNETREEVEYYLLHGEFAKYRKHLVAADFFPLAKDFPDLVSNYVKRTVFAEKLKEYNSSLIRSAKAEAYEEAYRDLLIDKDETTNQLIKMMKQQLSFRSEYDQIKQENTNLRKEIDDLKRKIKDKQLLGEVRV